MFSYNDLNQHDKREVDELLQIASGLKAFEAKDLVRRDDLGPKINFEEGRWAFHCVDQIAKNIDKRRAVLIGSSIRGKLISSLKSIFQTYQLILDFSVESSSGNVLQDRNRLISQINQELTELFHQNPSVAIFFSPDVVDLNQRILEVDESVKAAEEARAGIERLSTETQSRVASILENLEKTSGSIALRKYASFFSTEAEEARKVAKRWLIATVFIGVVVLTYLVLALTIWVPALTESRPIALVQMGIVKLAFFSVGFYMLSWCGRNYKAQWHTALVNSHRANALNTLEAFADSVSEKSIREGVIMHVSASIFGQAPTGFIPDQTDAATTPSILEVIRSGKND